MNIIEASYVTKRFDEFTALDGVSFALQEGERVLLLGPNGAGKTTLLRCIMGLLRFDGEIKVGGFDVKKFGKRTRSMIGYLPQASVMPGDLTCRQALEFCARLRGVDIDLGEVLRQAGLDSKPDTRIRDLSGGMRQRLGMMTALMPLSDVIVLDEPLSNLDVMARIEFSRLVSSLSQERTIIISIHALGELLPLVNRILIMDKGKLIFDGPPARLLGTVNPAYRVYVRATNLKHVELEGVLCEKSSEDLVVLRAHNLPKLLRELDSLGVSNEDVFVEGPPADEVVFQLLRERGDRR